MCQSVNSYFELYCLQALEENCMAGKGKEAANYNSGSGKIQVSHRELRRREWTGDKLLRPAGPHRRA